MKIKNVDLAEVYRMLNRFVKEVEMDESSSTDITSPFLIARMQLMYEHLVKANTKMSQDTSVETVEVGNRFYSLPEPYNAKEIINLSNKTCCNLLEVVRDELIRYQSANYSFNLMIWDRGRNLNLLTSFKRYIDALSNVKRPLDLPKTTNVLQEIEKK